MSTAVHFLADSGGEEAGYQLFADGENLAASPKSSGTEFYSALGFPYRTDRNSDWHCDRLVSACTPSPDRSSDTLNAVPRLTLLPLIAIWFGIGMWSKVVVVFLGAIIPIAISTHSGVKTSEARFLKVARSFGASKWKLLSRHHPAWNGAIHFQRSEIRGSRPVLGVVVGELYAATAGVGFLIGTAGNTFQTDVLFFGVLLFTAAGLASVAVLNLFERRFERWRPKVGSAT